jgi:hypothetical protein
MTTSHQASTSLVGFTIFVASQAQTLPGHGGDAQLFAPNLEESQTIYWHETLYYLYVDGLAASPVLT